MVVQQEQLHISHKSLLRYPGGKTRAVKIITQYFPKNLKEICSPFFGGGSIELYMASQGVKVYGYDSFTPLVEFWQCALTQPTQLAQAVRKYYPLRKKKFYELQQQHSKFKTKLQRAAVFYALNRSSFSGTTLSGGLSPHHPRFSHAAIQKLRTFYNPNVSVNSLDFKQSIEKHPDTFLYLDPPYLINSALYGRKGSTHKHFDHEGLYALLNQRDNWILSYNDCDLIRSMYRQYDIVSVQWSYSMGREKMKHELLILNFPTGNLLKN